MDIKNLSQSKTFRVAVISLGVLLVALMSFSAGVSVGLRKAKFSYAFGENYERNFGSGPMMPEKGMMRGGGPMAQLFGGDDRDFRNGHGLVGEILSVADDSLVVKDISGNESVVSLGKQTLIKNGRSDAAISGLKPGDKIAVIGRPADDGMIEARLIRVLPELRDKEER